MRGESYLVTVAALGIGLGGFIGLINSFRHRNRKWQPEEIAGMKFIFQHSFAAGGCALIPFPLFYGLGSESSVWSLSSGCLAAFLAFVFIYHTWTMMKVKPRRKWMLAIFFLPGTLAFFALQICNIIFWHTITAYSCGLLWLLAQPAIQFYHFLSFTDEEKPRC